MKYLFALLAILIFNSSFAQSDTATVIDYRTVKDTSQRVFTVAQVAPHFPGGFKGWVKYLQQNLNAGLGADYLKIPKGQKEVRATVIVVFTIDGDGNVSDVIAENEPHPKLVEEAIRVVKNGPKWIPAIQNGVRVTYRHRQPITWQVTKE